MIRAEGIVPIIFGLLILTLVNTSSSAILWNHFLYLNEDIYNLQLFNSGQDYDVQTSEGALKFRLYIFTQYSCTGKSTSYAVGDIGKGCTPFTNGSSMQANMFEGTRDIATKQFEFTINYTNISQPGYQYIVHAICQIDGADQVAMKVANHSILVTIQSKSVCPIFIGIKSFWFYFSQYKLIFFIIFIVFGLVLLFLGERIFKIVMFIIGFLIITVAIDIIFLQFVLPADTPQWAFWTVIGISLLFGVGGGVVCTIFYKVGLFLLGLFAGTIIGILLFSAVIFLISAKSWVLLIAIVLCGVGGGFVAWLLNLMGVVIGTAIIGSFMAVRACSWYIGGYPNEWNLSSQLNNKDLVSLWHNYWKFYIYLVAIVIITLLGIFVQYKLKRDNDEEKQLEEKLRYFHLSDKNKN